MYKYIRHSTRDSVILEPKLNPKKCDGQAYKETVKDENTAEVGREKSKFHRAGRMSMIRAVGSTKCL